jgi:hypothetical protein
MDLPTPKTVTFEAAMAVVNTVADGAGMGIDEGIKKPVAALMVHGFATHASCADYLISQA